MDDPLETTQSKKLTDIAADHLARIWYECQMPREYRSTRYVNGHAITVMVSDTGYGRMEELETMQAERSQEE